MTIALLAIGLLCSFVLITWVYVKGARERERIENAVDVLRWHSVRDARDLGTLWADVRILKQQVGRLQEGGKKDD